MRRERGFSYVIVMFLVAVLSLAATRALQNTLTAERRSKEAQLLAVGMAYRNAIRDYYLNPLGSEKSYPPSLKALLEDKRWSRMRRPLRKLYRDPITASTEWGVIYTTAEPVRVIGVYSLSAKAPIKKGGFPPGLEGFSTATSYRDWRFVVDVKPAT